jgi:hypothetical protein
MKRENRRDLRLLTIDAARPFAELRRDEEIKLQEEWIARNGVKRLPPVSTEAAFERWQRIADFRRELREKYKRPEATD